MKLYWGPHTCAIGIHILLEEAGAAYETEKIDVGGGATREPAFRAINPKGKVPTLSRDDGSVLTEFGAIATWIGRKYPGAGLLPDEDETAARMTEVLEYVEGTIHGQGFARLFKPDDFAARDVVHTTLGLGRSSVKAQGSSVKAQGKAIVEDAFAILDDQLADRRFAAGDRFTIADPALFYVERWAPLQDIGLPPRLKAHFESMLGRPSVQKVQAIWGEA